MGRLKKYTSEQEKLEAQRAWSSEYYKRNKSKINKKAMLKYYELRKSIRPNSGESKK